MDRYLKHHPEFHQLEHRHEVISAYGRGDRKLAIPMMEKLTFEQMNIDEHYWLIRKNMGWLETEDYFQNQGGRFLYYVRKYAALLDGMTFQPKMVDRCNAIEFFARPCFFGDNHRPAARLSAGFWFYHVKVLDALWQLPFHDRFFEMKNSYPTKEAKQLMDLIRELKPNVDLEKTEQLLFNSAFEKLPEQLGIPPEKMEREYWEKDFRITDRQFEHGYQQEVAGRRFVRLKTEWQKTLNERKILTVTGEVADRCQQQVKLMQTIA